MDMAAKQPISTFSPKKIILMFCNENCKVYCLSKDHWARFLFVRDVFWYLVMAFDMSSVKKMIVPPNSFGAIADKMENENFYNPELL